MWGGPFGKVLPTKIMLLNSTGEFTENRLRPSLFSALVSYGNAVITGKQAGKIKLRFGDLAVPFLGIRRAGLPDRGGQGDTRHGRGNDSNVLAFGARVVGVEMAKMITDTWLDAEFEGGRHQRRVDMLMDIEKH